MSLKNLRPDTPKEWAQIGMSVSRLGTVVTGITAFQDMPWVVLICALVTWAGSEFAAYMRLEEDTPTTEPVQ